MLNGGLPVNKITYEFISKESEGNYVHKMNAFAEGQPSL